jgi:hypothetical protein
MLKDLWAGVSTSTVPVLQRRDICGKALLEVLSLQLESIHGDTVRQRGQHLLYHLLGDLVDSREHQ